MSFAMCQVAEQAAGLERTGAELRDARRATELLERSLHDQRLKLEAQADVQRSMQEDASELAAKLSTGLQRALKYVDTTKGEVVQRHELEAVKRAVAEAKKEALEAVEAVTPRIKFELLAPESTQVRR